MELLVQVVAVAIIMFIVVLKKPASRNVVSRRLESKDGWAARYGFSPDETGLVWTARVKLEPRGMIHLSVRFQGDTKVISITSRMKWNGDHERVKLQSVRTPSKAGSGHPTLSPWYKVVGDEAHALAHLSERVVGALNGLKEDEPPWTVVESTLKGLECTYDPDRLNEAGLEAALVELVSRFEACVKAWPRARSIEDALDERLRDEGEPEAVRWRAMKLLLTRFPDSELTRAALDDVASWPDEVCVAAVIWAGPSRDMSEDEVYAMCREASASEDPEFAQGAARALSRRAPWRALTDARVAVGARVACAEAAMGDEARPEDTGRMDDALVGVLTGMLPEESARVALYEGLMRGGWEPSDMAGVKLAERGTDALSEAMVVWLEEHGAFGDTRATFDALRGQGFEARVDAALERSSAKGMLSVSGDASTGGLSETAGEAGALTSQD